MLQRPNVTEVFIPDSANNRMKLERTTLKSEELPALCACYSP